MKFVHIADMHFDVPFTSLNVKGNLGDIRRIEQRKIFDKIINYIKENNIDYFFISGDLYEHNYTKKSTIDYINQCFKEIPNTKVIISPGNHDPYIVGSFYDEYKFADNVNIFKGLLEKKEFEDVNIYGMAFNSFYMEGISLENIELFNNTRPNIFVVHCDLNGVKDENGFSYNNIKKSDLERLNFDYVAMGHIHKSNFANNGNTIIYPGSPISMGFDELGEHGMVVGQIDENKNVNLEFVKLDEREFIEQELNVQEFFSKEDLIIHLQNMYFEGNNLYKIILSGKRNFEIDTFELLKLIDNENILKIKDNTKLNYDLEKISLENNIKGYFVREALKKLELGEATKEEIEKAIEIGLESM